MPPDTPRRQRAKINLQPPEDESYWTREIITSMANEQRAAEDKYIVVLKAVRPEGPLTFEQIAELAGKGKATVVRWRNLGREARDRRNSNNPQPPGKRGSDG